MAEDFPIRSAPTMSLARFQAELSNRHSPAAGDAAALYATCLQFGVNPAVALGFFGQESTFGTDPNGLARQTHNWANLTTPTRAERTTGATYRFHYTLAGGQDAFHDFPIYKSWVDGLADFCDRLTSPHGPYAPFGLTTVSTVIPKFAPQADGNHPAAYIAFVIRGIHAWMDAPPAPAITADSPLLGPASGRPEQAVAYIRAQLPAGSEYAGDVESIMGNYWQLAPPVGLDPFLLAAHCILETDALRAYWAGRPRRNPANLGVPDPSNHETGLSFPSWTAAVPAHLGYVLALVLRDDQATAAQQAMLAQYPLLAQVPAEQRGVGGTVGAFARAWSRDPAYANTLVSTANAVRQAS